MASSVLNNQTKELLVHALKKSMETMPLDKITISCITKSCNVSRRAFYYHFEDVYQAAIWMFEQELGDMTISSDAEWNINIAKLLEYVESNKVICLNALNSSQGYRIENLFFVQIKKSIESKWSALCEKSSLDLKTIMLVSDCYAVSMQAIVKSWVEGSILYSSQELLSLFEKTIDQSVSAVLDALNGD